MLYCISVPFIQGDPSGHFTHVSITTPVVFALKNYYAYSTLELPRSFNGHFKPLSDQGGGFRSETAVA
jgi:hypothetical protein